MNRQEEIKVLQSLKEDTYFAQVFKPDTIDAMCRNIENDFPLDCGVDLFENCQSVIRARNEVKTLRGQLDESVGEVEDLREQKSEMVDFLLDKLHLLKERNIHSYVQFTLNHYKAEGFEPAVPSLAQRIDTFKRLVDALGIGAVIWRYDPIILTDKLQIDDHLGRILAISDMLKGYCEKLVFSFADIAGYRKVQYNMNQYKVAYEDFTPEKMAQFAKGLKEINSTMGLELATCGEQIDLSSYGIEKNRCIDPDLIAHLFHDDKKLMYWLGYDDMFGAPTTFPKDSGQRAACGRILSKDIGAYTTCGHGCLYCYANTTPALGKFGCERAISEPLRESLGNL